MVLNALLDLIMMLSVFYLIHWFIESPICQHGWLVVNFANKGVYG